MFSLQYQALRAQNRWNAFCIIFNRLICKAIFENGGRGRKLVDGPFTTLALRETPEGPIARFQPPSVPPAPGFGNVYIIQVHAEQHIHCDIPFNRSNLEDLHGQNPDARIYRTRVFPRCGVFVDLYV